MFQYGPFQLSREMTIISVRNGSLGNAHSEYFGPMAESGVLGILSVVALFVTSVIVAMRLMYKSRSQLVKYTAMAAILGLITYYIHGLINDYLDLDKAAIPVWALMAIITALDLYYNKNTSDSGMEQNNSGAVS
jgi:O-antigen ligase